MWKSDDTGNEELLQTIIDKFENGNKLHFPEHCPVCKTKNVHLYYNRFSGHRGGNWVWCSNCKYYAHSYQLIPEWWINCDSIPLENLCHEPTFLEQDKEDIDIHVNKIVRLVTAIPVNR